MTLYRYRCESCRAEAERWFPMGEAPARIDCIVTGCGANAIRTLSGGAFMTVPGAHNATYGGRR